MLRIPSFRKIGDLTVCEDDAVWTRFYLVPSVPTIRRDAERPADLPADDLPHLRPAARGQPLALARGGGFMNFDVQFAVDEAAGNAAARGAAEVGR